MLKVLIIDDQEAVRTALSVLLDVHDIPSLTASGPEEGLRLVKTEDVGVVIQDMNFTKDTTSGEEGAALFRALRAVDPTLPIVLVTAWTSLETAVELVREGAADYVAKPWEDRKLVLTVQNLLRLRELDYENLRLRGHDERARRELASRYDLCGIVYQSRAMHDVLSLAVHVAPSDAAVLVSGPNGSGKERIAAVIHKNSRRKDKPFVTVNAGGLPDQLLEAELFGAEAGAFTGAAKLRIGRFEAAHGGTLFLDEIGNLSPTGQMKLLRVLQTGEFERLGSSATRKADVRIVSATNAALRREIDEGRFREDLYFRLNVIELEIPALSRRTDDIAPLAAHFIETYSKDKSAPHPDYDALAALEQYDWPGNVRELENRIQRALLVCRGGVVTPRDLGFGGGTSPPPRPSAAPAAGNEPERQAVEAALVAAGGVVSRAAAQLGLSRQALYRRMERLGIEVERRIK